MEESGFHRFPGNLDPRAQEFFPTTTTNLPLYPHQIYYPHPSPPAPPLPPPPPASVVYSPPSYNPQHLPVSLPPPSSTPTRTLILTMVPADVSESSVRRDLEVFGDVRAVQMERLREGVVTVHFYDVRDAQAALMAIQEQHMQQQFRLGRHYDAVLQAQSNSIPLYHLPPPPLPPPARGLISGCVVWAQFTSPVTSALPDGNNQGTIVIFNLDHSVSPAYLREIFEAFGPVKELRETPYKKNQRFVEFYDVRNAAKAVAAMDGKEINGKQIVIQLSRPGGRFPRLSQINRNYWSRNSPASSSPQPPSPPPPPLPQRHYRPPPGARSNSSMSVHDYNEPCNSSRSNSNVLSQSKKVSKKKNNNEASGNNGGNGKSGRWKSGGGGGGGGKHGREFDPRFLIKEDAIMESNYSDSRTTVMIKNIPNKYSQKLLLNMLDNHCIHCNEQIADDDDQQPLSAYDFVYLPIDFINKCNVGYGFVNMTSPEATLRLYKAFHNQSWEVFNSRKICEVTYARLQGIEALREHFKNSKFPGDAEEYMPVVFSPPRDGMQLTEPMPIVAGGGSGRSTSSGSPPPLLLSSSSLAASSEDREESESSCEQNVVGDSSSSVVSHDYEVARDRSNPSIGGDT